MTSPLLITDLPILNLALLFRPHGVPLIDKGADKPTTSIAILGDAGAGKTTLAVAFAHAIAKSLAGSALYITTELVATELAYKIKFLRITDARVLPWEEVSSARGGDVVAQHLALVHDETMDSGQGVEDRALRAALHLAERTRGHEAPVRCVVIDAFPLQKSKNDAREQRDDVVALVQTLEGRGISVVIIDEDGGLCDYLPFVTDIVFEARFERDEDSHSLVRRVVCRKSRYAEALPGPHDTGIEFDVPGLWPDPLPIIAGDPSPWMLSDARRLNLFLPVDIRYIKPLARGALVLSAYDKQSPLPAVLQATPGSLLATVNCGPINRIWVPGHGYQVPDWEGPHSLSWALFRASRDLGVNAFLIQGMEEFLASQRYRQGLMHAAEALRQTGHVVCFHGRERDLRPFAANADYVWNGPVRGGERLPERSHRNAANWLALKDWPVERSAGDDDHSADSVRAAVSKLEKDLQSGNAHDANAAYERILSDLSNGKVEYPEAGRLAFCAHMLARTAAARKSMSVDTERRDVNLSLAWAAALAGDEHQAISKVFALFTPYAVLETALHQLWAALLTAIVGSRPAEQSARASLDSSLASAPFLIRAFARHKQWSDVDELVAEVASRSGSSEFLAARMRADARLESGDAEALVQAEALLSELSRSSLPVLHMADVWFNLGVVRASRGRERDAMECWKRVLELVPWHEPAKEQLARHLDASRGKSLGKEPAAT